MRKGGRQPYGAIYADSVDRLCNIYVALRRLYNTACINMVRFRLGLCRNNNYIHERHNNPVGGVPCCVTGFADCDTTACETL